jgi:hypothetical protein
MTTRKKMILSVSIGPVTRAQCQAIVETFAALGREIGATLDVETFGALELIDQKSAHDVSAPPLRQSNGAPMADQEAPAPVSRVSPPSSRWN